MFDTPADSKAVGAKLSGSEWLLVTQDRVNLFAESTDDHLDPRGPPSARARARRRAHRPLLPDLPREPFLPRSSCEGISMGLTTSRPLCLPVAQCSWLAGARHRRAAAGGAPKAGSGQAKCGSPWHLSRRRSGLRGFRHQPLLPGINSGSCLLRGARHSSHRSCRGKRASMLSSIGPPFFRGASRRATLPTYGSPPSGTTPFPAPGHDARWPPSPSAALRDDGLHPHSPHPLDGRDVAPRRCSRRARGARVGAGWLRE